MKKIAPLALLASMLFLVAACSSYNWPYRGSAGTTRNVTFRVGMLNDTQSPWSGDDVVAWQDFLQSHGCGLTYDNSDNTPNDHNHWPYPRGDKKFDSETEQATMRFQASVKTGDYHLPVTGIVNPATYHAAILAGLKGTTADMSHYQRPQLMRRGGKYHTWRESGFSNPPYAKVNMFVMASGCTDATDAGSPKNSGPQVSLWQYFLYENGYLNMASPTGTYGSTTTAATTLFQEAVNISPALGNVTPATFTQAYNWTEGVSLPQCDPKGVTSTPTPCPGS